MAKFRTNNKVMSMAIYTVFISRNVVIGRTYYLKALDFSHCGIDDAKTPRSFLNAIVAQYAMENVMALELRSLSKTTGLLS